MPGVQFALSAAVLNRVILRRRNGKGAIGALAVSLSLGACADQVAQYEPPLFVDSGAPVAVGIASADQPFSSNASVNEDSAASGWSERTYVYRGGRDPKTGLARTQL